MTKEFKPFTLEIKVNTKDELHLLWHRFNISNRLMAECLTEQIENADVGFDSAGSEFYEAWKQLDKLVDRERSV